MTLVSILCVGLALWLGFWLGRRWEWGEAEEEAERAEEEASQRRSRGGIRLRAIRVRR